METVVAGVSALAVVSLGCLGAVNSILNSQVGSSAGGTCTSAGPGSKRCEDPAGVPQHGTTLVGIVALYSVIVPLLSLTALAALALRSSNTKRMGRFTLREPFSPFFLAGGLCGVVGMICTTVCTPKLGAVLYFSIHVCGALSSSLLTDHYGFLGLTVRSVSSAKVAAAAVAICGVTITACSSLYTDKTSATTQPLPFVGLILLCLIAGALSPVQALINWRLGHALPHKTLSLVISASVSLVLSLAVLAVYLTMTSLDTSARAVVRDSLEGLANGTHAHPWMWLGAAGGVLTCAGSIVFPRRIGASAYFVLLLTGEMSASLLLDNAGALGMARRPATPGRIAGIFLVLAAALGMRWADEAMDVLSKHCGCLYINGCTPVSEIVRDKMPPSPKLTTQSCHFAPFEAAPTPRFHASPTQAESLLTSHSAGQSKSTCSTAFSNARLEDILHRLPACARAMATLRHSAPLVRCESEQELPLVHLCGEEGGAGENAQIHRMRAMTFSTTCAHSGYRARPTLSLASGSEALAPLLPTVSPIPTRSDRALPLNETVRTRHLSSLDALADAMLAGIDDDDE